ncbi:DUF4167 domain-containing protein [Candidatus Pelagibacter sp.]|uniref:DUF4167 domain-containing protein n=1 Tax=Candidatus Pelagibacter sp. TaxID=2024849 RepID=UPI003F865384
MVTFRNNNNKRSNFRRNDRNFKSNNNVDRVKFSSNFSNNENFQRKSPGRNNHNAPKLIEKYNNLAREALSAGDKILSENYFQHADHFTRILNEQESFKKKKQLDKITDISTAVDNEDVEKDSEVLVSSETQKKIV